MSDNPGSEVPELISLGVDVDVSSFDPLNNALNNLKTPLQAVADQANSINQAFARGEITSTTWAQSMREAADAVKAADNQTKDAFDDANKLNEQIVELSANYKELGQSAAQAAEAPGVGGATPESEEGGRGMGSMFGVAHAASVAGMTFDAPALREAGAFIYMGEGIKRLSPLLEKLDDTVSNSTVPIVSTLTSGLEALGVPAAGLALVLIPVAAAVAAVVLVLKELGDQAQKAAEAEKKRFDQEMALLALDEKNRPDSRSTSSSANKQHELDVKASLDKAYDELARLQGRQADVNNKYAALGNSFNPGDRSILGAEGQQIQKDIDELMKHISTLNNEYKNIAVTLPPLIDLHEKLRDTMKSDQERVAFQVHATELVRDGTVKQVETEIASLKDRVAGNNQLLSMYSQLDQKDQDVVDATKKLKDENALLEGEIKVLIGGVLDSVKAREAEADAIKEQLKQMEKVEKALIDYNQAREKAVSDLANQEAAARQREGNAERQYTQGSLEDTEARRQIALKESREETKLKEDTANRIADIGMKLGEKQTQDIIGLSRQLYDDQIKYQEGAAKYEREAQDQAVDDKKEHLARLADLNKKDTADETEALLDRNFKKLYTDGLHRQESIDKENESYQQREDKLTDHLRRQERELAISTQQEEAKQKLALQRKLEDDQRAASAEVVQAVISENRKLQALEQSERLQLQDLTAMEGYKIRLLHQGLTDELILYRQQEEAKLALLARTRDLILGQNPLGLLPQGQTREGSAPEIASRSAHEHTQIFDSGGSFNAGEPFMKGNISENFMFGGKGYNLGGAAIVYPLQSGTATPAGGKNITFAPNLYVSVPAGQQLDGKRLMNELWGEFQSLIGPT